MEWSEEWILSVLCVEVTAAGCSEPNTHMHTFRKTGSLCTVYHFRGAAVPCGESLGRGVRGGVGWWFFPFRWIMTLITAAAKSLSLLLLKGHEHAVSNICSDRDLPHTHLSTLV